MKDIQVVSIVDVTHDRNSLVKVVIGRMTMALDDDIDSFLGQRVN
jgi:hypothetical protein